MMSIHALKQVIPLYPVHIVRVNMLSKPRIFIRITAISLQNSILEKNI
ncbi:MAG: hypothetical protein ACTS73_08745 [Arsenophonus sp. NEOnobi-MAG3]